MALLVLVGLAVRVAFPGRLAIDHFDEGVYSSNLWFTAEQGYAYPARHLYAPPLLPALIEWVFIFSGVSERGPLLPGMLAGVLTVPSVWWIGRAWLGRRAGLVAGSLAAASDFHSVFSRTALTDPILGLVLLWAVYFGWRAIEKRRGRDILLGGLLTGIAWWTKYNGWLPVAILGAALPLDVVFRRQPWREVGRRLATWLAVAAIALAIWGPVWWGLQSHGGYSAVAANHRQYVVGVRGWPASAAAQWSNLAAWEGGLTVLGGPLLAAVALAIAGGRVAASAAGPLGNQGRWRRAELARSFGLTALQAVVTSVVSGIAAAGFLGGSLLRVRRLRTDANFEPNRTTDSPGLAVVLAWFAGLFVATPLYYPYPRLVLPWLVSTWLVIGGAWSVLGRRKSSDASGETFPAPSWFRVNNGLVIAVVVVTLVLVWRGRTTIARGIPAWEARTGLAVAIQQIGQALESGPSSLASREQALIYVFGEPAVFHHLRADGWPNVGPVANLDFARRTDLPPVSIYLLVGPHTRDDAQFSATWNAQAERWERVVQAEFAPSPVLWRDRAESREDRSNRTIRPLSLELFRLRRN